MAELEDDLAEFLDMSPQDVSSALRAAMEGSPEPLRRAWTLGACHNIDSRAGSHAHFVRAVSASTEPWYIYPDNDETPPPGP